MNLAYYAQAINQDSLTFDVGNICIHPALEINGFRQGAGELRTCTLREGHLIRALRFRNAELLVDDWDEVSQSPLLA